MRPLPCAVPDSFLFLTLKNNPFLPATLNNNCGKQRHMLHNKDLFRSVIDHLMFLLSGTVRPELSGVEEILKPIDELAALVAPGAIQCMFTRCSLIELAVYVHEKLGNDAKAEEAAAFQLTFTRFHYNKSAAYRALGRISKRRGDEEALAKNFDAAADFAYSSNCPFLALLAGKERGGEAGEAMIEKACEAMGKTRSYYVESGFL